MSDRFGVQGRALGMGERRTHWLSVQQTAMELDSTSAEICRLLKLGRLSGTKQKVPGRPGKAQWLVNPRSISKERRYTAKRLADLAARRRKRLAQLARMDGKAPASKRRSS